MPTTPSLTLLLRCKLRVPFSAAHNFLYSVLLKCTAATEESMAHSFDSYLPFDHCLCVPVLPGCEEGEARVLLIVKVSGVRVVHSRPLHACDFRLFQCHLPRSWLRRLTTDKNPS
jgi:hypothetical protein